MNLTTNYLGLSLKNPVVPSSSPFMRDLGHMKEMEDAGAAALVLHSLFEEEINQESHVLDRYLSEGANSFAEALSYFPEAETYAGIGPDGYLRHIEKAKKALDIPIIASLNGVSTGGWVRYAKEIEAAGADALEVNLYYIPTDLELTSIEVELLYLNVLHDLKKHVSLPIAFKLNPFFSATANFCYRLVNAGVDGLVMFNRFYQPDLDLEALEVIPNLVLSQSSELRLPLRWIAILYGRVDVDFGLTTGVHNAQDVLKSIAAGANVAMLTSELLQKGIGRISDILTNMQEWLEENEYEDLDQLRGSLSQMNCGAPAAFERANYLKVVKSYVI